MLHSPGKWCIVDNMTGVKIALIFAFLMAGLVLVLRDAFKKWNVDWVDIMKSWTDDSNM